MGIIGLIVLVLIIGALNNRGTQYQRDCEKTWAKNRRERERRLQR